MIDRHLEAMLLRQKGQNRDLVKEILEKISPEGRERLFRILQDFEYEVMVLKKKSRMPWLP